MGDAFDLGQYSGFFMTLCFFSIRGQNISASIRWHQYRQLMSTIRRYTLTITLLWLLFCGGTESAWALQSHGPPEGNYVHQMAHILFMAALAYLYWHTRRTQELTSRGWKYLQLFCFLLFFWNFLAFTGHEALEHLEVSDFIDKNTWREQLATPITPVKLLYYITKMDHFLMVPALFSLVISLRTFYLEVRKETQR
jgi:hypothetical protein